MARTTATRSDRPAPAPAPPPPDTQQNAELEALRAEIAELRGQTTPASPSATVLPAASAGGAPTYAMSSEIHAKPGDVIRYVIGGGDTGADPTTGYGLVLDVLDVDDEHGGPASEGRDSHKAVVVAQLDVLGRQLVAANIVDEKASAKIAAQRQQQDG